MDSAKLHDWLQIVGAAAIVASLIFVGLQLKQSQEIAVAGQYQQRYESSAETARAYLQSDVSLKIWGTAIAGSIDSYDILSDDFKRWAKDQPPEELAARIFAALIDLKALDNNFFQYQQGYVTEEAWQAFRATLKAHLAASRDVWIVRDLYLYNPEEWPHSFQVLVEEIIAEIDGESAGSLHRD